ncbi:glutamate synthase subunit beta [Butyrivibrio sp. YAB3001]|uniref:glutamate synthase subunit beta n=1 Tax=Butyrivibrio sp. YAB3001 TaxID=1520812 RepID=UPI0008F64917|nr:glutamate synthase subunit beta [Butyrivibrio sp. YAB3001]SFC90149.1 glutamate synthase (NADPH/NADH) small chain [Butyrivibrio sp. YAB3001]
MGKETGFLEYRRVNNGDVPASERIKTFAEFHTPLIAEDRRNQAARCMNCGVPFCQSAMNLGGMVTGCPLHNLIPEWNDEIYRGHDEHAFNRLHKTSNFPEFTGRVCPALCEKACMCGQNGEAVTVHDNELFLIETAFEKGYIKPLKINVRSGKKVAVIGSGPSGLAVADELNHRGHHVEVFEREDEIGGLLMYGIPNMKLDKSVIKRRRKLMEEEGVVFHTGVDVGRDKKSEELLAGFDAVVLCCGAKKARPLAVCDPATDKGVYYAVDFLTKTTKALLTGKDRSVASLKKQGGYIDAEGKHVIIVGGGDTGNDCIGTSIRMGAKSVTAIEMMPKPPVERLASNPWPEWPKVLKTDYGHEEAIHVYGEDPRVYETTIKSIVKDKKGAIKQVETVKVKFNGGKLEYVPGTEQKLKCDILLIAAGFVGCEDYTADEFAVKRGPRGTVLTADDGYHVTNTKIFCAGDMHRGQSLVVWAIAEGRACAKEVDEYLMGYTNL